MRAIYREFHLRYFLRLEIVMDQNLRQNELLGVVLGGRFPQELYMPGHQTQILGILIRQSECHRDRVITRDENTLWDKEGLLLTSFPIDQC